MAALAQDPAAAEEPHTSRYTCLDSLLQLSAVSRAWALPGAAAALVPAAAEAYLSGLEGAGEAALARRQLYAVASIRPGDLHSSMCCDYQAGDLSGGAGPVCSIAGLEARAAGSLAAAEAEPVVGAQVPSALPQQQHAEHAEQAEQEDSFGLRMLYAVQAVASEPAFAADNSTSAQAQLVLELGGGGGGGSAAAADALSVAQQAAALGMASVSLLGSAQLEAPGQLGGASGGLLEEAGAWGLLKTLQAGAGVATGALGGSGGPRARLVLRQAQAGAVNGAERYGSADDAGIRLQNVLVAQVGLARAAAPPLRAALGRRAVVD